MQTRAVGPRGASARPSQPGRLAARLVVRESGAGVSPLGESWSGGRRGWWILVLCLLFLSDIFLSRLFSLLLDVGALLVG